MVEQNDNPTPAQEVHIVNKKGVSNTMPKAAWDSLVPDAAGWRRGWKEVKKGENPAEIAKSANVPAEFKTFHGGKGVGQGAIAALQLSDDEKKALIQTEINAAIAERRDEIERLANEQADKNDSSLVPQIEALAKHITENHGTIPMEGSAVEQAIGIMKAQSEIIRQFEEREDSAKQPVDPSEAANAKKSGTKKVTTNPS